MNNVSKFPVHGQPKPICPRCAQPAAGTMVVMKSDQEELHFHEVCWLQMRLEQETKRADAATRILASTLMHLGGAMILTKEDFTGAQARQFRFTAEEKAGDLLELRLDGSLIVPPSFGVKP